MSEETFSSDESMDEADAERNFDAEAQLIIRSKTLPTKSADRYLLVYETYKQWQLQNKKALSNSEENNLIVYFKNLSEKLKPPTLWSIWSMLKKTLNTRDNIDIGKFQNLKSLIKQNSKGYRPKKSSVFKWNEIMKFIDTASDYIYLASKVVLIFGICGALRCDEITKVKIQDVEDLGDRYLVSIDESKNDVSRQFIVGGLFYPKVKQYILTKPTDFFTDRFFIQYQKGKCHRMVIGRNRIGEIPQDIARYLQLPEPKQYTGHCFRRSSGTLLAEGGGSSTMLKQLGGWKSLNIAQGYVENSLKNRQEIFNKITHETALNTPSNPQQSTSANYPLVTAATISTEMNTEENSDTFTDDFEINEEDVAAIEQSNQSEVPGSPRFTTANNKKILITSNQPQQPKHFLSKPPVTVFFEKSDNQPPLKKSRIEKENSGREKNSKEVNEDCGKNPYTKYENCTFGNVTNNYYCYCTHKH